MLLVSSELEGRGLKKTMTKVVVPLEEQEVIRLEAILVDRDEVAALEYLRKVVMQKIEQQRQAHCKPPF